MNYPLLPAGFWGGGLLIAMVAVIHVFIAHFAVGGGFFIAVMETRARKLGLPGFGDYLRRYAEFFLVVTMVFGAMTGVGIWFAISMDAPTAASTLIHTFVLGWASEWAMFLGEIVVLMAYRRVTAQGPSRTSLILAWLYFLFAWGSLAVVQGFISFMLTPGQWLITQRFWDGFLNPTYLPGLVFRTAMACMLAGLFALYTAQIVEDQEQRRGLASFSAWWAVLPLPVAGLAGWWHVWALSAQQRDMVLHGSGEIAGAMSVFWLAGLVILSGGAAMTWGLARRPAKILALGLLVLGFLFVGSFEWMREAARKPYIISGYMYSNSILVSQGQELNQKGVLALARWSARKSVDQADLAGSGQEVFRLECASCHSVGGPMHDIVPLSAKYSAFGFEALLTGLGKLNRYMPPFFGLPEERKALAAYVTGLHAAQPEETVDIKAQAAQPSPFPQDAQYVLLGAADQGLNMLPDAKAWTMGIGSQGLSAQLIRRDASPELVSANVVVSYAVPDGPSGDMAWDQASGRFRAKGINVSPYAAGGGFDPYPLATLTAKDAKTGQILAETKVVLPVSTELGCKNCHGGGWSHGVAGLAPATARDVLIVHDQRNHTRLASQSGPVDCRSCHNDAASGGGRALNLSAAVHGLHAVYLAGRGREACDACHPSDPQGATRALRDPHQAAGLDCLSCHGALEDLALSLLAREDGQGVGAAKPLMQLIAGHQPVTPRQPWVNEPKCLSCHTDYGSPQNSETWGDWTAGQADLYQAKRDDLDAVACASCHGAVHALYPADNPYAQNLDNLQPLQYQGLAKTLGADKNCKVCHMMDMDTPAHHSDMGLR